MTSTPRSRVRLQPVPTGRRTVDGLDLAGAIVTHKVDIAPANAERTGVAAELDFVARLRRARSVSRHQTVGRSARQRRIHLGGAIATRPVGFAPANAGGSGVIAVLDFCGAMVTLKVGFAPSDPGAAVCHE